MSDFSPDDLFETIDHTVSDLLGRHGLEEPPVDTVTLAQEAFDLRVTFAEDEPDDPRPGRFGPRPTRRNPREIVLRVDQSDEGRNLVCGRACGRELLPTILTRLGVTPGTENRSGQNQLLALIVPRLLLPTRWIARDARKLGWDVWDLKDRYPTVGYEMIALRLLDIAEEPLLMAIVDDGTVATRRGNRSAVGKKLTETEQACLDLVMELGEPQTVRRSGWTVRGWPVPGGPFNRIILRAVPDEL